jgi:hypothetical protein
MKRLAVLAVALALTGLGVRAQTVTGSGTPNKVTKFTGSSTIGDSVITENAGNVGIGITNPASTLQVVNTNNFSDPFGFGPYAIYATENSTINFTSAVRGDSLANTGGGNGVIGLTSSAGGAGVRGVSVESNGAGFGVIGSLAANVGGGGGGILGETNSTTNFSTGVRGNANGTSGAAVAIFGEQFSSQATSGLFINRAGGDILQGRVGKDISVFRVDGRGTVFADGGLRPFGADFAESVAVKDSPEPYAPGDLLVIDASGRRRLSLSQTPYSTLVAGIYSTQPGVVASQHRVDEALPKNEVPLAVIGIVPCNVTAENGPIAAGDLLVTSSTPGRAMKGTDRTRMLGAVVGKALEPLREGAGVIQVLVTLQ